MAAIRFEPAPTKAWARAVQLFLILVGLLAAGIGVWVTWAPVGMSYSIVNGELVVTTKMGLSSEAAGLRIDRITEIRNVGLSGGSRTAGIGRPGYCVGNFRYPDLGPVWQATNCGPEGVFIQSQGRRPLGKKAPGRFLLLVMTIQPRGRVELQA